MKMKRMLTAVFAAGLFALSGCGGGKASLYGCWRQTESSQAGFIRWNPSGYSEMTEKSDEVLRISEDGWFDVYGAGFQMIHTKYTFPRKKRATLALELRNLSLTYAVKTNILHLTALDMKTSTYRKLTAEEEAAFLSGLGGGKPAGPAAE